MSDESAPVTHENSAEEPAVVKSSSFEQLAQEDKQPGIIREFFEFLGESKSWWLTPIIVVLLLVGLLVLLSSSVVAPFIYPIF